MNFKTQLTPKTRYTTHTSHSAFISYSWLYSGYTTHLTLGTHPIFGELAADFQTLGVVDSRTELTADDRSFLVTEPTEIVVTIVLQNTETKIWRGWQTINESLIHCPANLVLQLLDFTCLINMPLQVMSMCLVLPLRSHRSCRFCVFWGVGLSQQCWHRPQWFSPRCMMRFSSSSPATLSEKTITFCTQDSVGRLNTRVYTLYFYLWLFNKDIYTYDI